jgi:hyperosmotically inducible periplasmic protein
MIRGLLRLVLLIAAVVVAAAFLLGYWGVDQFRSTVRFDPPNKTVGTAGVDREKARAVGAEAAERTAAAADRTARAVETAADKTAQAADRAGDKAAYAAEQARKAMAEGSLTAKIKAKMALDDHVKALDLNVDTKGTVVTVSGTVSSQMEKDRALQLARDTAGVTQVIDRVQVRQ